ncbi:MAG: FecR domain-containing protein, partial [Deltaproteobacteria bacterium]|nr:FecR domain-containing protein [Deltaproteobacteria bacterium]
TVFVLEKYTYDKGRGSAVMRLFKGGLRAVTGLIAKRNLERGYRLHTPTAVVGVRGTEFDARLCEDDCADETREAERSDEIEVSSPVVGRITHLKGNLTARIEDGTQRSLIKGGPVYEGDTLETGSNDIAVMVFRDNSRVALHGESRFKVEQYRYRSKEKDNVFFRLFRGGMRVMTGLAAKRNARAFKVGTPTAVLGVRGTGFDLLFQGSLPNDEQGPPSQESFSQSLIEPLQADAAAGTPQGDGMFVQVWEGVIELQLDLGIMVIEQGQTAFFPVTGMPSLLPTSVIPPYIRENPAPRPDRLEVDMDNLFGVEKRTDNPPGLYVSVYDGHVTLENEAGRIELGRGEAGFIDMQTQIPVRLEELPLFQIMDKFPSPNSFEERVSGPQDNFLNDSGLKDEDKECDCEIR